MAPIGGGFTERPPSWQAGSRMVTIDTMVAADVIGVDDGDAFERKRKKSKTQLKRVPVNRG